MIDPATLTTVDDQPAIVEPPVVPPEEKPPITEAQVRRMIRRVDLMWQYFVRQHGEIFARDQRFADLPAPETTEAE